jgi:hypothetical protein
MLKMESSTIFFLFYVLRLLVKNHLAGVHLVNHTQHKERLVFAIDS